MSAVTSGAEPFWFYNAQFNVRYYYDESGDRIVYENGSTIARPPEFSREQLIAARHQAAPNRYVLRAVSEELSLSPKKASTILVQFRSTLPASMQSGNPQGTPGLMLITMEILHSKILLLDRQHIHFTALLY